MEQKRKAVALRYDREDRAPVVVAKGMGELAEKIIKIAKREGVPIVEDRELTEALLRVEVLEEIPPVLYEAVARVLVFIQGLDRKP